MNDGIDASANSGNANGFALADESVSRTTRPTGACRSDWREGGDPCGLVVGELHIAIEIGAIDFSDTVQDAALGFKRHCLTQLLRENERSPPRPDEARYPPVSADAVVHPRPGIVIDRFPARSTRVTKMLRPSI